MVINLSVLVFGVDRRIRDARAGRFAQKVCMVGMNAANMSSFFLKSFALKDQRSKIKYFNAELAKAAEVIIVCFFGGFPFP